MAYPLPLSRILKDLEAWDEARPGKQRDSPIVPHNKGVSGSRRFGGANRDTSLRSV